MAGSNARSSSPSPALLCLAASFLGLLFACGSAPTPVAARKTGSEPPVPTRQDDVVDDYHGTKVPDPYRWLEDQDGAETRTWTDAQNAVTGAWLEAIDARETLRKRLTELWNYEKQSPPRRAGERWIHSYNDGLRNQATIYVADRPETRGRALLDPNTLSQDGTVALGSLSFSEDGSKVAWSFSKSGSDWREFKVRDVATGQDLDDHLQWTKFTTATWLPDGKSFLYSRFEAPAEGKTYEAANKASTYCLHVLGTDQKDDPVVWADPAHPERMAGGTVSDDGSFVVLTISSGTDARNRVSVVDIAGIAGGKPAPKPVIDELEASYRFLGNEGRRGIFFTDKRAPRGRIVSFDLDSPKTIVPKQAPAPKPDPAATTDKGEGTGEAAGGEEAKPAPAPDEEDAWKVLVPQTADTLASARIVADRLVLMYLRDAHHVLRTCKLDGSDMKEARLPALGSVSAITGRRKDTRCFFAFESFTLPPAVYELHLETGEVELLHAPKVAFDAARFETRQVAFQSADGTRVPMFLVHRKGLDLDRSNPTYLYGYGGFNISLLPRFSPATLAWLELGGIYAQPTLRGGGEFGKDWHEAGMLKKKQNVFDDFLAAARYLIANDYTSPARLAIGGGSNGGLLVGAALTQRPDLFGAAIPEVGVLDMLRYHKFTIGHAWIPEYGSADDPGMFATLHAYSPLHNVRTGTAYPPTLIMTGDHDDRVLPGHSYKFAAALQRAQGGEAPILLRVDRSAGHGAGKPTTKQIDAAADRWAFLVRALRIATP